MTRGIYQITCRGELLYIGQSRDVESRLRWHRYALRKGIHDNSYLLNYYNKYGEETFDWETVEEVEEVERLTEREIFWILELTPRCNHVIPQSDRSWTHSVETRRKISESHKLFWTEEKRRGKSQEKRDFYNSLSPEEYAIHLELLGRGRRGKPAWNSGQDKSTDPRIVKQGQSISLAKKGKPPPNKGVVGIVKRSEESRRQQSETVRNKPYQACPHCGQLSQSVNWHLNYCSVYRESTSTPSLETPGLGKKQKSVIESLLLHREYFKGCGWKHSSHWKTVETLDSLVARGLVEKFNEESVVLYRLRGGDLEDECETNQEDRKTS